MKKNNLFLISLLLFAVLLTGCRGYLTKKPPIHPNPNMDWQPKVTPQTQSVLPPEGTIPWGRQSLDPSSKKRDLFLKPDTPFYTGKNNGKWVQKVPVKASKKLLLRGQERYNIYCAACHTEMGDGTKSQITKRGWIVSNLLEDITYNRSDGELYDIVGNGIRSMPGYKKQILEEDRWAIVLYLRALQNTQRGSINDVPYPKRSKIK